MRNPLRRAITNLFLPTARSGDASAGSAKRRHLGEGVASGMELVLPPLIFLLLGLWIDDATGLRPLFTILLFALGAAGTFCSAYYRYRARSEAEDEGKPWARRDPGRA